MTAPSASIAATAAAVSHELRSPLSVLRARLHALCDGVVQPDEKEFARLLEQVEHLGRLVEDLHTLSMADADGLSLYLTDLDLVALAADTLADHASRCKLLRIDAALKTDVPKAVVRADKDRMRQVLSNLVENAMRYASAGRWLEIGVTLQATNGRPAFAVLTVSDAGDGLPSDVQAHLFQRFVRSGSSRARANGGSGLGLSIVHALVTLQGGTVEAGPSERGGTRFTIRLPCNG
jgi:signal transduction histidine kinase